MWNGVVVTWVRNLVYSNPAMKKMCVNYSRYSSINVIFQEVNASFGNYAVVKNI